MAELLDAQLAEGRAALDDHGKGYGLVRVRHRLNQRKETERWEGAKRDHMGEKRFWVDGELGEPRRIRAPEERMHRIQLELKASGLHEWKGWVGFNLQFAEKADVFEIWGSGKDAPE
jgi:hypothetical protein